MSHLNPEEARPGLEPASAESTLVKGDGKGACTKDRAQADRQLVDRCLAGEQRAWEQLYRKNHPRLRKAIELLLGADAADVHLMEEIAARVWYALLRNGHRLLGRYDPERDSNLDSFLMGLARIEILRHKRAERRRYSHELLGGRRRLEEQRVSDWQLATMMDEFASTLTQGEKEFMDQFLTGAGEYEEDVASDDLSPTSIWQRRHRIRLKLNRFLKNFRDGPQF